MKFPWRCLCGRSFATRKAPLLIFVFAFSLGIYNVSETYLDVISFRDDMETGSPRDTGHPTGTNEAGQTQRAPKATIAYTIVVTSCDDDMQNTLLDGAAVLQHSVHLSSIRGHSSKSNYDYKMIAFVHDPDATSCARQFERIGYEVHLKKAPVHLDEIRNQEYANIIKGSGCCGEKEFMKLYGYNLTDYPVVVQLDIDTLMLKPFDPLFDLLLQPRDAVSNEHQNMIFSQFAMWPSEVHVDIYRTPVSAFFTRDYNSNLKFKKEDKMVQPNKMQVQGAFLILRPNPEVFNEYIELIKTGDFAPFRGWTSHGWGGMRKGSGGSDRFQGLVSYYYSGIHPNDAIELNPCYFNQNAGEPRTAKGVCATSQIQCQDCRKVDISEIYSVHFGGCGKPWHCPFSEKLQPPRWDTARDMCLKQHHEWHRIRNDFETSKDILHPAKAYSYENQQLDPTNMTEYYSGHCIQDDEALYGSRYIPIDKLLLT